MAKKTDTQLTKVVNAFQECFNPLRNLTKPQIDQMIQNIRTGNDIRLQVAYAEMERQTPIFGVCINKRLAGITNRAWDIVPMDESPEAKAQAEAVKEMFLKSDTRNLDGLTEALRNLGLAAFRGRAVTKPFISEDGDLHFRTINNWNALEHNDKLYWNPKSMFESDINKMEEIPETEVIWLKDDRPIDMVGIQVYLRQLVGETEWARAIEKYSVCPAVITVPEGTPDTALDLWTQRARAITEGGIAALPNGANVSFPAGQIRGQNPFSEYVDHQMKMICILAVGSTGMILGDVGAGLGSDVVTKQDEQFNDLVSYDCKRIANSMTQVAVRKCVHWLTGKYDVKCRFSFVEKDATTAKEYLELASIAKSMGITIDVEKLRELTNLQFISSEVKDVWTPVREPDQNQQGE